MDKSSIRYLDLILTYTHTWSFHCHLSMDGGRIFSVSFKDIIKLGIGNASHAATHKQGPCGDGPLEDSLDYFELRKTPVAVFIGACVEVLQVCMTPLITSFPRNLFRKSDMTCYTLEMLTFLK